jgi:hemerythrin-like domain-containing protein
MSKAIEILMNEHRVIETVLGSLDTLAQRVEEGRDVPREEIGQFVDFFRNFADKCHHGKEEDLLFSTLEDYGFSAEAGPVAVMLSEHERGRAYLQALAAVASGSGPLNADERSTVIAQARGYIELLINHILKEDRVLFPMAEQALSSQELNRLEASFVSFEENIMGAGTHEGFHRLADTLVALYPPTRFQGPTTPCMHHH